MGGKEAARKFINETISKNNVVVFSKSHCPFCTMAKESLNQLKCEYIVIELENRKDCSDIQDVLKEMTGARSVPRVFIKGTCIGGGTETKNMKASGELAKLIA